MLDWTQIDTVLLDMDGTLLDLRFDNHFWLEYLPLRYAEIHRGDADSIRDQLFARFERERGTLNWYCIDYWERELDLDIVALKREVQHMIAIRPYVLDFLRWLKQGPQSVWLVTNAHRKSLELKLDHTGIGELFDRVIVSHDFNAPKEDTAFWHKLHTAHPFDPGRSLLIDDTVSVLESAQRFGIRHLLTLVQPDSQRAKREQTLFPGIHHFDEIMPELRDADR